MHESSRSRALRRVVVLLSLTFLAGWPVAPAGATASPKSDRVIVLPGATSAEGIAAGAGNTFYAGALFGGDIFRGDVRRGTAGRLIDAPEGRMAVGMVADVRHGLLFVAGGFNGQAHVYDLRTGAEVATYQFAAPDTGFVNDVALSRDGAWFTDSIQAHLYFVPIGRGGALGPARTLTVTGPAADTSADFNLNGIQAAGRTLIVAHSAHGRVYTVDPATGASALIAGVEVPNADGLVLSGRRLWVVQNADNQVTRFRLDRALTSGTLEKTITHPAFDVPTTAALVGHRLAVVNAHLSSVPPTSPTYEVIVVKP